MQKELGEVNAETILSVDVSKLQSYGMTFRKAEYIIDFSEKVHSDAFNLANVRRGSYPGIEKSKRC